MALSLESLYKPVNEFFLNKFASSSDNKIFFRFDKFSAKISEGDFSEPENNPEEEFSDFVNRVPVEDSDKLNVLFLSKGFDEAYRYQILEPALPFIPPGTSAERANILMESFNTLKSQAIKKYDGPGAAQVRRGVPTTFLVSFPNPGDWYENDNLGIWEHFSSKVTEQIEPEHTIPKKNLWRIRLNDHRLSQILPVPATTEPLKHLDLKNMIQTKRPFLNHVDSAIRRPSDTTTLNHGASSVEPREGYTWVNDHWERKRAKDLVDNRLADTASMAGSPSTPKERTQAQLAFHNAFKGLNFTNKIAVSRYIKEEAETREVTSNDITVSFEFSIVTIKRPWYFDVFMESKDWYIPGQEAGEISTNNNLAALATGFVMVKNLKISASWSTPDREIIKNATDFGPFQIDSTLNESGSVGYTGSQVIGWILQKMPVTPPNSSTK